MAEKTEKPTPKKLRDAAKKGQTFKSKDLATLIELAVGAVATVWLVDVRKVMDVLNALAVQRELPTPHAFLSACVREALFIVVPLLIVCVVASALPSLIMSRFAVATEAIKFDLSAINPISGFKKIFSLKTLKELLKAILYLIVTGVTIKLFVAEKSRTLFRTFDLPTMAVGHVWMRLTLELILLFLACSVPVVVIDAVAEYLLYYKNLKMDRHEIEQEHKNTEGDPEIKGRRREVHIELLSEETKANIRQSDAMLANPTHIAIGIYMNTAIAPLPFVSVRETNARALAALRYAEQVGVPVVRDIALARSIYRHSRLYTFVDIEDLRQVFEVLKWLREVEHANQPDVVPDDSADECVRPDVARD